VLGLDAGRHKFVCERCGEEFPKKGGGHRKYCQACKRIMAAEQREAGEMARMEAARQRELERKATGPSARFRERFPSLC
jgi:predicted ATP-dependent serine protease